MPTAGVVGSEIIVSRTPARSRICLYLASAKFATEPKVDKCNQSFGSALSNADALGISSVFLPCEAIREYRLREEGTMADESGDLQERQAELEEQRLMGMSPEQLRATMNQQKHLVNLRLQEELRQPRAPVRRYGRGAWRYREP